MAQLEILAEEAMSTFLQPGRRALNQREEQILTVLTRLMNGQPIESLDDFGLLRYPVELGTRVGDWVNSSREIGGTSRAATFWIQAPRGGGKTEALRSVQRALVDQGFAQGFRKSIVVPVDLLDPQAAVPAGLQEQIFRRALLTKTSPLYRELTVAADRLTTGKRVSDPAASRAASIALDVIFAITDITVPGVGTLVSDGVVPSLRRRFQFRRGQIEKALRKVQLDTPVALNILATWLEFGLRPTQDRYSAFAQSIRGAAERQELFHLFCRCLEAAGVAAIILLVDECDELVGKPPLVDAFQNLWNRPAVGDPFEHRLDICFVMAMTGDPARLNQEAQYGGFPRRFFGPGQVIANLVPTEKPEVRDQSDSNDDLAKAIAQFRNLLTQLTHGVRRAPSEADIRTARAELNQRWQNNTLTWHALWERVATLYTGANTT